MVLSRLEGPGEALLAHLAASAHLLGFLDLEDGRSGVADREEQLRVLIEARRAVTPIHGGLLLRRLRLVLLGAMVPSPLPDYSSVPRCERFHEVRPDSGSP